MANQEDAAQSDSAYYDLGPFSRVVTTAGGTAGATAQVWFDRGLNWLYAFNHFEAVDCFQEAIGADPTCAMAHWGVAYAAGPFYNYAWCDLAMMKPAAAPGFVTDMYNWHVSTR